MSDSRQRVYRSFRREQRRLATERALHSAVVQVQTAEVAKVALPAPVAEWWSDLRRGRLNILGGALRTIDVLKAAGRPDAAVTLAETLLHYAQDDDDHGQAA